MKMQVSKILEKCDILNCPPWDVFAEWAAVGINRPITLSEVLAEVPFAPGPKAETRKEHLGRILWFFTNGWNDPIQVDVGVPVVGFDPGWIILDGNHRFAAAVLKGDKTVLVDAGGDVSLIEWYCAE